MKTATLKSEVLELPKIEIDPRVKGILVKSGLDFIIEKEMLIGSVKNRINAHGVEERIGRVTPYYGLFHSVTNECINTGKKGYTVSQNEDIVNMVLLGIEQFGGQLNITKAGPLHGGRKVFMQLEIEGIGKVNDDVIKRYITILDSNDGSMSLSIGIGDLTLSCTNQFARFYAKSDARFRHSASIADKIKTIPFVIEENLGRSLRQIEIYNELAQFGITDFMKHEMVKTVLGYDAEITPKKDLVKKGTQAIKIMNQLYLHIDKEIEGKGENMWGLHSGVTSFTSHESRIPNRDNARIESTFSGQGYKKNNLSFEYAMSKSGIIEMV